MTTENDNPAAPAVSFANVSFSYGRTVVLEDVALDLHEGESVCVVGPNGGGKTTFLKLVLGLLKPDRGEVRLFGEAPERTRRLVGYVPQRLDYDRSFPVSVMDIVRLGGVARFRGGPGALASSDDALAALARVGMAEYGQRLCAELSGGQRQRVLIARALVAGPRLLMLDEPTASVDPGVEAKLTEVLQAIGEQMTILMASHDLGLVSRVVERVVCVNRQAVVHPTSELTGELLQDIYGDGMLAVRHDLHCSREGHDHD